MVARARAPLVQVSEALLALEGLLERDTLEPRRVFDPLAPCPREVRELLPLETLVLVDEDDADDWCTVGNFMCKRVDPVRTSRRVDEDLPTARTVASPSAAMPMYMDWW